MWSWRWWYPNGGLFIYICFYNNLMVDYKLDVIIPKMWCNYKNNFERIFFSDIILPLSWQTKLTIETDSIECIFLTKLWNIKEVLIPIYWKLNKTWASGISELWDVPQYRLDSVDLENIHGTSSWSFKISGRGLRGKWHWLWRNLFNDLMSMLNMTE